MIIENKYRSRACGEVSESDIGKVIRVAGWVENIRDHGGIRFVDLRDQYGICLLYTSPPGTGRRAAG